MLWIPSPLTWAGPEGKKGQRLVCIPESSILKNSSDQIKIIIYESFIKTNILSS